MNSVTNLMNACLAHLAVINASIVAFSEGSEVKISCKQNIEKVHMGEN